MSRRGAVLLASCALAATVTLPAGASGSTKSYAGAFDAAGASVTFKVTKKHHKTKIKNFTFAHLPIACDDGPHTISAAFQSALRVKKKSFSSIANFPTGGTASVLGKLSGGSASGNVEVNGAIPVDAGTSTATETGCETGIRPWTASRASP